jgi:hypothetical protein
MTLATTVRVKNPIPLDALWEKCREIVGIDANDTRYTDEASGTWDSGVWCRMMNLGLGYDALLMISYKPDGFFDPVAEAGECDDESDKEYVLRQPDPYFYRIVFDTAYGFDRNGESCSTLHYGYTTKLGIWLDEQGADWVGYDEVTGEWGKRPMPREGEG